MLLISADLDELIGLSDTIRVLLRGRLVGTFDPQTVTPQELGSAMTGAGDDSSEPRQARSLSALAAPVLALVVAGDRGQPGADRAPATTSPASGTTLLTWPKGRNIVNILNASAILYISGVAAAIGFRMNLFNIGVEGQYRVAAFAAAAFAGAGWLPGKLNTIVAILVAMVAGALWAGIAGLLRTTRGVSEVISTIMLNAIAGSLVGYFLTKVGTSTGNTRATKTIDEGSWVGGITLFADSPTKLFGLSLVAILVGVRSGCCSTGPASASTSAPPVPPRPPRWPAVSTSRR